MKKGFELKQLEWIVFVIVMIILFFSTQTYFGTANYSRIYHIDRYCMLAFLGVSIVANHGVIRYKSKDLLTIKIVILPYIFLFAVSVFFYMTNHRASWSSIINTNIQAILVCLMAIVSYYSLGKGALKGVLIAAIINYFIYIVTCIVQYGPLALFQAGSDSKASRLLEVHEVTFVFGILIVYLLISDYLKSRSVKKRWVVLLAVFCLLGFKRILLMAMLIGIIVYFCARRAKKPNLIIAISVIAIVLSLMWVLLTGISIKFGIDLAGRNWIYSNFYPYYNFSISYLGAGVGYVQEMIYTMSTMVLNNHSIGLHNEYMRLFIELGFIPYITYFVLIWPVSIKILYNKVGYRVALVNGICIATDNLLTYPNFMLAFWLILITIINETPDRSGELAIK